MDLYNLPLVKISKKKEKSSILKKFRKRQAFWLAILVILASSVFGFLAGTVSTYYFVPQVREVIGKIGITKVIEKETVKEYLPQTSQEEAIIKTVEEASSAVVSIVISKDVPIIERRIEEFGPFELEIPQQKGFEKKEVGGGTGFIVSKEGLVLTNKHVVLDEEADYTIFTKNGKKYPAKVLAKDPFQDLAILKIEQGKKVNEKGEVSMENFPVVRLGDSDNLKMGQTVIAIGNALGEFRNTVSVGVISGLGRRITASDGGGYVETLEDVIQTDAAINRGNSGGPLLNLNKEVVGINTAMVSQAQSIGFAIPVNKAKRDIEQVREQGEIVYPFLGVRYVLVNEKIQEEENLPVDYGALIVSGEQGDPAIVLDSAADKAGLEEGDIILELKGERITEDNSLSKIITKYNPRDKVTLKILRGEKEKIIEVTLGEKSG